MSHILIIGAGIAGLQTACDLLGNGHTVTLLEARDRIGGRINTIEGVFSSSVEAGAEFVHGSKPITAALLKKAGAKQQILEGNHYQLWANEVHKGGLLDEDWSLLNKRLAALAVDTDIATFLKHHFPEDKFAALRQRVRGFAEGFDAADINRVSAFALRQEWNDTDENEQGHIVGGYIGLLRFMEKEILDGKGEIIFSSPVEEISWTTGKVKALCTTGKQFDAEKIIVTVPLGVIQSGVIRFTPELRGYSEAFHSLGRGGVNKFLFEFKSAFWEHTERAFRNLAFLVTDASVPTWWTQLPENIPLLTGWKGGPETFLPSTQEELYQDALQSLSYILKTPVSEIQKEIVHWKIMNWQHDPFARGAYGYATVDTAHALAKIKMPLLNTVYFAGEHIYQGQHMGTVEAALTSAKEVVRHIG